MTSLPDINASLAQLEDELTKFKSASEILQDSESSITSLVEHSKTILSTLISQYRLIAQQNLAKAEEVGARSDRLNVSVAKLLQKMEDPGLIDILKEIKHQDEILGRRISEVQQGIERNEQNLKLFIQQIVQSTIELQRADLDRVTKQIIQEMEQLRSGVYAKLKSESDRNENRAKFFAFVTKKQDLYLKTLIGIAIFIVGLIIFIFVMISRQ